MSMSLAGRSRQGMQKGARWHSSHKIAAAGWTWKCPWGTGGGNGRRLLHPRSQAKEARK